MALAKDVHPGIPVLIGGIYARLCEEHAQEISGADRVITEIGPNNIKHIIKILKEYNIAEPEYIHEITELQYPAFDMLSRIDYICISTSFGCTYKCQYCASRFLNPSFSRRNPVNIIDEILYWHREYGIQDFAFYDDALLVSFNDHMGIVLEKLVEMDLDLRFHTPNALHVREISSDIASLLYIAGFHSIRLGLETSDIHQHDELDKKVSEGEFERAVYHLKKAGFTRKEIGVYILMGLPGQSVNSVFRTISLVGKMGATPYLAEYSPLPHTPMWEKAITHSTFDLSSEPLYHNNTLLPCWDEEKKEKIPELKQMVLEIRKAG